MTWTIVEDTKPQRCCARCGISWADYLRERRSTFAVNACSAYGRPYYSHKWIWWEPDKGGLP
jgi:hypothetical protein